MERKGIGIGKERDRKGKGKEKEICGILDFSTYAYDANCSQERDPRGYSLLIWVCHGISQVIIWFHIVGIDLVSFS